VPPEVYPVNQVTRYLRELLEADRHLANIWVAGEISNYTRAASGHIFFTLKDDRSGLRCAFFRNRNMGFRTPLANGLSVVVYGSLSLYEQRGELSFVVDFVHAEGAGVLAAEFERRRAAFEAEGLFAEERKRPLPRFPRRVGVVTSPTGAVFHDIADVLARRWPLARLLLQPAPVQGDGAGIAIAEAIRTLARVQAPDVIIVARGGGAAEDLWAFNEEAVVRAIFGSPVPVVSAVGHETDVTLADMVADLRAPTPSAAAELVAPDRAVVGRQVAALQTRMDVTLTRAVDRTRERVDLRRVGLARALPDIAAVRARVSARTHTLAQGASAAQLRATAAVEALDGRVRALSPYATMERGYALVQRPDGVAVTTVASLHAGDRVDLRLRDGARPARIEDVS
jgi:exodeoxyribonuclease VII large subunit